MDDLTLGTYVVNSYEPFVVEAAAFGGVVEAHLLNNCNQFPAQGVTWKNIVVYADTGLTLITPDWSVESASSRGITPSCNYAVNYTSTSVSLAHHP